MHSKKKLSFVKLPFFLLVFILCFSIISAINVQVEKTSSDEVLIEGLGDSVIFNLSITNLGNTDTFEIYNLVGFSVSPSEVTIKRDQTEQVQLELTPIGSIDERGYYIIPYYIKASDNSQFQEKLTFKIIDLEDAFEMGSGDIDLENNSVEIYIRNLENKDFKNLHVDFSSPFFEGGYAFDLGSKETENFVLEINSEDFRGLTAGFYTMTAEVSYQGFSSLIEESVKFVEKDIVTTTKTEFGFIVNKQLIERVNEGNIVRETETVIQKNTVSRLFTSFSPEPSYVERDGGRIYYTWINEISPGEKLEIIIRTNWLLPFLIIVVLVGVVVLVKRYSRGNIILRKKVSFVRAKGGEFALKVSIFVNPKTHIERVNVVDRLPSLVNLYERFGSERPSKIDKKNRKIEWNFERLEAGEVRVLSYVIYSKVGVLGRFALPTATAIYEKDGNIHESESNRAFFVAEQNSNPRKDSSKED